MRTVKTVESVSVGWARCVPSASFSLPFFGRPSTDEHKRTYLYISSPVAPLVGEREGPKLFPFATPAWDITSSRFAFARPAQLVGLRLRTL